MIGLLGILRVCDDGDLQFFSKINLDAYNSGFKCFGCVKQDEEVMGV